VDIQREINFWVEIMKDHARFMRNGFDPTEDRFFDEAHEFYKRFKYFTSGSERGREGDEKLLILQNLVLDFVGFKSRVGAGIQACKILSILPAEFIFHIRREAMFFLGILARLRGGPRLTRQELNIPGQGLATTVPQVLIPQLRREFREIAYDELFFWLEINYDHAGVLAMYFRPGQEEYMRETLQWERQIKGLYDEVKRAFYASRSPEPFIPVSINMMKQWEHFLQKLLNDLTCCTIPGKQMNIWPRIVDHMIRENNYFLEVLEILRRVR